MSRSFVFGLCSLVTITAAMFGCNTEPAPQEQEPVGSKAEALIAPGMLEKGYSPIKAGAEVEVVAILGVSPLGIPRSIENFRFASDGTIWATSLTSGEILHILRNTGEVIGYQVPVNPGTFLGGIDLVDDLVVFAAAAIASPVAYTSSLMTFNVLTEEFTLLLDMPNTALNGVVIMGDYIFAVDALRPEGIAWRVPLAGGSAEIWYQGSAGQPDPEYVPTPCNPPWAMGFNGGQKGTRLLWDSLITSNTTKGTLNEIPIYPDGSAGSAVTWYSSGTFPDDIAIDRCGLARKGAFLTTHGIHEIRYLNPYRPNDEVVVAKGLPIDGPTSAAIADGKLWIARSADPLICRPDEDGNPDPSSCDPVTHMCVPGEAAIVALELDPAYVMMCTW